MSEVIDTETIVMLKEVMGEDFQELVTTFLDDCQVRIPELCEQLAAGDADALRQTAHSLKGSSGNLGATTMSELCFHVETKAKQQQTEDLASTLERIEAEFQRVTSALRAV
ncbi:Hpt domain-containing protein [Pseudomaricurvus sp.]|uniref:Hpt domain-containing protein n=1 Tax=Pseudomaricurvus sp. TaxID=2004510 RepID=UPI003F6C8925